MEHQSDTTTIGAEQSLEVVASESRSIKAVLSTQALTRLVAHQGNVEAPYFALTQGVVERLCFSVLPVAATVLFARTGGQSRNVAAAKAR